MRATYGVMSQPAVLLLNLGSPASPSVPDVRAYLKEFLLDERVIDAPTPIRNLIVRGFILPFRPKQSAKAYASVWTDEGSPLIVMSQRQQKLLAEASGITVELAMRYGQPSVHDAVQRLRQGGVTRLLVVPLYPHYAMSSYETAVVQAMTVLREQAPEIEPTLLQPFYRDEDYIAALLESARPYLEEDYDRLQFSFHGIPVRHLTKSDPSHAHCNTPGCCDRAHPCHTTCYRHQCFETVKAFVNKAGIPEERWGVSFQSRLGRDPWLEPYTDQTLAELPKQGIERLLVICPAFVTDCLETIEEISEEGKELFEEAGGKHFAQIPCLNDHPAWIQMLTRRVLNWARSTA